MSEPHPEPRVLPEPSPSTAARGDTCSSRTGWPWIICFVLAFALYAATANRGIQWQDSGHRILRVVTGDVDGGLGLALSHPLHHWLGRLAALPGWTTPALAVTLVSALGGALAIANVCGCVRTITRNLYAALFAAGSLAVAHTFWQMATITETYTLTAALLAGELWCLAAFLIHGRRSSFLAMFLLNGLGVANHLLAGLTTPILLVIATLALWNRRVSLADCATAAGLWLAGSLPYSAMVLAEWMRSGDFAATLRSALFGTAYVQNVLNTALSAGMLARAAAFIGYNFPSLLIPAAFLGMLRSSRPDVPRAVRYVLLAALIVHVVFVARYNIQDQQTFFLPTYVMLSIFGGMGAARVLAWPAGPLRRGTILTALTLLVLTPVVYVVAPMVARRQGLLDPYPQRPFRDNYVYFFTPWSVAERSAERMSEAALALARPDGVVFYQDRMAGFALEYKAILAAQTEQASIAVAPLPKLDTDQGRARLMELLTRPDGTWPPTVFVPTDVRKAPPELPDSMKWTPRDNLYVLEPRDAGPQSGRVVQPAAGDPSVPSLP